MKHPDGRGTSVPVLGGRDVAKGTLRNILSDVNLTPEELLNPKLAKANEIVAAKASEEHVVDPREGVADPRGATRHRAAAARGGGRRSVQQPGREKGERGRRR